MKFHNEHSRCPSRHSTPPEYNSHSLQLKRTCLMTHVTVSVADELERLVTDSRHISVAIPAFQSGEQPSTFLSSIA
jgi:hypothetical protein